MTEFRDARLKRALQAAPDASAAPQDATRRDIREAAQRAVARIAPSRITRPWWRRWMPERRTRMPWNAAFATVLVAVVIGVMWRNEQPQDLGRESAPSGSVPSVSTAPAAAPPAAAPAPAPTSAPVQDRPAARARKAEPIARPAPKSAGDAAVLPAPAREPSLSAKAADTAAQARAESAAENAAQASRDAAAATEKRAAAPMPAAPAPPPAAPPAAAPAPAARFQQAGVASAEWTELRIAAGSRSVQLPRSQAGELAASIERLVASATTTEGLSSAPDTKIELLRGDRPATTLEIAGDQVRVTGPGMAPRTGRPDARWLQQLREETARLLAR